MKPPCGRKTYETQRHRHPEAQSEVARAIARESASKLTPREERRLARAAAVAPQAYEAYLKGRHLWNRRTEDGMRKSIAHYEQAIRLYPQYAMLTPAWLIRTVMLACRGMVPAKDTFRKRRKPQKAIDLDSELERLMAPRTCPADDWDWRDWKRTLSAPSISTRAGHRLLLVRRIPDVQGRPEEAIAVTQKAQQTIRCRR